MVKLNLGCGNDYRSGWVNVDANQAVRVDARVEFTGGLPLRDSSVDEVLLDNVIEHVSSDCYFAFIDELWRVCRPGAQVTIFAPHYSGMHAFKHPGHYMYFGVGSFNIFEEEEGFNAERYCDARFHTLTERLLFFHHNLVNYPFLSRLPMNWLFNFGTPWRLLMERFQFMGFDEIQYLLEVVKPESGDCHSID